MVGIIQVQVAAALFHDRPRFARALVLLTFIGTPPLGLLAGARRTQLHPSLPVVAGDGPPPPGVIAGDAAGHDAHVLVVLRVVISKQSAIRTPETTADPGISVVERSLYSRDQYFFGRRYPFPVLSFQEVGGHGGSDQDPQGGFTPYRNDRLIREILQSQKSVFHVNLLVGQ